MTVETRRYLQGIGSEVKNTFVQNRMLLSFDGYLELERDDRLVFDDEDRNTPKQCKKSIIRVSKPSISMAQSFHREDEIHRETLRIPLVG